MTRKSTLIALVGRQFSPATDTETAPSVLWFATIQCIESKQDLAGLAPKGCFVSAEAIEREVGQIGETERAVHEIGVRIDGRQDRQIFGPELGPPSELAGCFLSNPHTP